MAFANSYRQGKEPRNLKQDEIDELKKVYGNSIDLTNVYICRPFRSEQGVMVVASIDVTTNRWAYLILWSTDVHNRSAIEAGLHNTLIHEMMHVWQGQHGIHPTVFMGKSMWSQFWHGVEDIYNSGEWKTWDIHRGTTYLFNMADIGADFNRFNVEQQASIVESWYWTENHNRDANNNNLKYFGEEVYCGGASIYDPRYPYIKDVILAGKPNATYQAITLPAGGNADIKKFQNKLVQLGYLDANFADGIIGGRNSQTRKAVTHFQKLHNLVPDGDLGGPKSLTRAKLNLPLSHLTRRPK
jgi:hypothetical protein